MYTVSQYNIALDHVYDCILEVILHIQTLQPLLS